MRFRSKVDAWLAATLAGSALVSLWAAYVVATRASGAGLVAAMALLAVGAALPLWMLWSTRYEIGGGRLRARCGPFRWDIPLAQITRVTPSNSAISSPALSLDRLRIEYGPGKALLVSPRDRDAFLRALDAAKA